MSEYPQANNAGAEPDEDELRDPIPDYPRLLSYRAALILLALLAVLAAFTLTGVPRIFILIVDAGLALKVILFHFREKLDDTER